MRQFSTPMEIDQLLKLPRGRAKRLAKRGLLPATILADGTIRFDIAILEKFLSTSTGEAAQ